MLKMKRERGWSWYLKKGHQETVNDKLHCPDPYDYYVWDTEGMFSSIANNSRENNFSWGRVVQEDLWDDLWDVIKFNSFPRVIVDTLFCSHQLSMVLLIGAPSCYWVWGLFCFSALFLYCFCICFHILVSYWKKIIIIIPISNEPCTNGKASIRSWKRKITWRAAMPTVLPIKERTAGCISSFRVDHHKVLIETKVAVASIRWSSC